MASVTKIPFRKIPRQSALFLDYIENSPAALRFYQQAPTAESLENTAIRRLKATTFPRSEIVSILRRQNQGYGCDPETLSRINELEDPDCVAIVTGQQVGLFTGPLYTFYKALTAIHMAAELRERGIRAVPVFWMETEDHDLAEATHGTVLNPDSSPQIIDFRKVLFHDTPIGSVGSVRLPESILDAVRNYVGRLPDGVGKPEIAAQLESTYRPGSSFAQSFAELLFKVIPGLGLILFNPHDPQVKRLMSAVFQTAVRSENALRTALLRRSRELETAGFHAQVKVQENSTVLFFFDDDGERRAIERRDSGFGLRHTDRTFRVDELLNYAAQAPERFSPNVLLRPLIQDHLFPTAAYVGGSSELAYFAQVEVLYELYDRPMPVLWPRASMTLVNPEVGAAMERLGINVSDWFEKREHLAEKAVRNTSFAQAAASLDELQEKLEQVLTEVKPELQTVEPPLAQALETARRKIQHNVQHLKSQVIRLEEKRNSSISADLDLVLNNCYPNQNLQERELGIHHFLARHGSSLLDLIQPTMDIRSFAHRVIRLP